MSQTLPKRTEPLPCLRVLPSLGSPSPTPRPFAGETRPVETPVGSGEDPTRDCSRGRTGVDPIPSILNGRPMSPLRLNIIRSETLGRSQWTRQNPFPPFVLQPRLPSGLLLRRCHPSPTSVPTRPRSDPVSSPSRVGSAHCCPGAGYFVY